MNDQANRPFRFGVQISRTRSGAEWIARAQHAEALDYDVFLMPDHFGDQFGIGPALATVAAVTSRIRIGTLVLQNDLRHPALMVKDAMTLDVLSGGRYEIGIGAGGSFTPEYGWTGIPFDPAGVRVSRLEECIQVIKGLAGDDPYTFAGTHYTFEEYEAHPKPFQQPHPPILIAGGGKRMLALAGREADIVGLLPSMKPIGGEFNNDGHMDAFAEKADYVRQQAGPRAVHLEFNILVQQLKVTDDSATEIAHLQEEHGIENPSWFESPMVYIGTAEEIAAKIRLVRERIGASYFTVFEHVMEDFAQVIPLLR